MLAQDIYTLDVLTLHLRKCYFDPQIQLHSKWGNIQNYEC